MNDFQLKFNNFLNLCLNDKTFNVFFDFESYATNTMFNYIESSSIFLPKKINKILDIELKKFVIDDYDEHLTMNLLKIKEMLIENHDLFQNFIIHGSIADLKIVKGWSDFDSICVLSDVSITIKNRKR